MKSWNNKGLITLLFFCFMTFTSVGYCELTVVKSNLNAGNTVAVPIYSNGDIKAYAAADLLDIALCWTSYPQDGKLYMRMYYECQNEKCKKTFIDSLIEGINNNGIHRWSNIEAKHLNYLASDTIFDLPNGKLITATEMYIDKWGYLMASKDYKPYLVEELSEKYPFSFEVATKINDRLSKQLKEAKENPHSCINVGTGYNNSPPRIR